MCIYLYHVYISICSSYVGRDSPSKRFFGNWLGFQNFLVDQKSFKTKMTSADSNMHCEWSHWGGIFSTEQWGERSDPVHPSIQSWDRYFWSCSKRVFQLTVTLLTPSAVSSDTSSRLGRSATVVLVGTWANQTFNWHCISFEMKFLTSQLPVRLGVDPWMNATLAASVSK